MKRKFLITLLLAGLYLALAPPASAQERVPAGIQYQSVIRDNTGKPLASKDIVIRIKVVGPAANTLFWQEDHELKTSPQGMVSFAIGSSTGIRTGGNLEKFTDIPWISRTPHMEVLADIDKTGDYKLIGTNTLWSVPYAIVADSALHAPRQDMKLEELTNVRVDIPVEGQILKWDGMNWIAADESKAPVASTGKPGGDLGGPSIDSAAVTKIQGRPVENVQPSAGQVLTWNGLSWVPESQEVAQQQQQQLWKVSVNDINYSAGNVGIGTGSPEVRLDVRSTAPTTMSVSTSTSQNSTNSGLVSTMKGTAGTSIAVNAISEGVSSASGANWGVYAAAKNAKSDNAGVRAEANAPVSVGFNTGVVALADSSKIANRGLFAQGSGTATRQFGVIGRASGAGDGTGNSMNVAFYGQAFGNDKVNVGVWGEAIPVLTGALNYAGYFDGNVYVKGSLAKAAGTFKIDHPTDPENKYLVHSFVESPDMMNIYNGNVSTGADSLAVIALPDYFGVLNRDFRYQLTVIGDFAQAIVVQEVNDNHFTIKTSKPGIRVSWQVTGIRNDPYAVKNPIVPVQDKLPQERGKFLHPELYGHTQERAIFQSPNRAAQPSVADR